MSSDKTFTFTVTLKVTTLRLFSQGLATAVPVTQNPCRAWCFGVSGNIESTSGLFWHAPFGCGFAALCTIRGSHFSCCLLQDLPCDVGELQAAIHRGAPHLAVYLGLRGAGLLDERSLGLIDQLAF